jgi:hypothetical protein
LWKNKALIGGLSSQAIVIVDTTHQPATEIQRIDMKQRIRGSLKPKMAPFGGLKTVKKHGYSKLSQNSG